MLKALNNVGGAASYILSSSLFLDLCWLPRNWQVKSSIVAMARDASMWGERECLNVKIPWANRNKVQSPELPGTRDFKSLPRCTSHRISQGARVQKRLSCKGGFSAWLQSMLWPFWPQHCQQTCWFRTVRRRRPAVQSTHKLLPPLDFHQVFKVPDK